MNVYTVVGVVIIRCAAVAAAVWLLLAAWERWEHRK